MASGLYSLAFLLLRQLTKYSHCTKLSLKDFVFILRLTKYLSCQDFLKEILVSQLLTYKLSIWSRLKTTPVKGYLIFEGKSVLTQRNPSPMSLNTHLTFAQSLGYLNYDWNITEDKLICLIFLLKITSCACFEGSGLKFFFHWKAQRRIWGCFNIQDGALRDNS